MKLEESADDNRLRRINAGERKRLNVLKKDVRFEVKKRKVLKFDTHYDSILAAAGDEMSTMDTVLEAEFYMKNRESGINKILRSHRPNDKTNTIIKAVISAGVYPQYAIFDQYNVYKVGNELFAHTRLKPFAMVHPNSCLALLPEALNYDRSDENLSRYHQLISFATFMETSKPFLCHNTRVPALLLLLLAKTVICSNDEYIITCDDFIIFNFRKATDYYSIIDNASSIRRSLAVSMKKRLDGEEISSRALTRSIVTFLRSDSEFIMTRKACPALDIEIGFFLPSGEKIDESVDSQDSAVQLFFLSDKAYDPTMKKEDDAEDSSKGKIQYNCQICHKTLYLESAIAVLKHKRSHK